MVNAPTRRPPTYPDRRRQPRGRRPVAGSIRDRLTAAAAQLKEAGQYDSAAAVESVIAPRGYLLLKKEEQRASASTLTITTTKDVKDALVMAQAEFGVVFSGLAEEAYRKVRDREWLPVRAGRSVNGTRAVLNVSIDGELRDDVREMLAALSDEAGYRISEGGIVLSYICEELGVERPEASNDEKLRMVMPAPLVEHLKAEVKKQNTTFQKVLSDGLTDLADGVEVLPVSMWITEAAGRPRDGGRWSPITPKNPISYMDRGKLDLKLDPELMARLRHRAAIESSRHQVLVHVGAVGRAILTSRLGEPDDFVTTFDPSFE